VNKKSVVSLNQSSSLEGGDQGRETLKLKLEENKEGKPPHAGIFARLTGLKSG